MIRLVIGGEKSLISFDNVQFMSFKKVSHRSKTIETCQRTDPYGALDAS